MRTLNVLTMLLTAAMLAIPAQADDDEDLVMWMQPKTPFFQPIVGQSNWSLENTADIESSITIGAVMGFDNVRKVKDSDILRHQSNGLYVTYHMAGDEKPETFSVESWRFGFVSSESYGYAFNDDGVSGFYLTASKAPLSWYGVSINGEGQQALDGYDQLNRYPGSLRFGEAATAGLGVRVAEPISINAGFEWALAYERHIFWYWAGSAVVEGIADGLASWFVREVGESSPVALPIMHFILRNGVAMGFKALRQNEMNWPIGSAAPLNIMTYSIGVNVHF